MTLQLSNGDQLSGIMESLDDTVLKLNTSFGGTLICQQIKFSGPSFIARTNPTSMKGLLDWMGGRWER